MNNMIKKYVFEFAKVLLVTFICSIIAVCLMTLAFMVPMNRDNLYASVLLGNQEGYYVDVLEHIPSLEKYFTQFQPGTMTVADDVRGFHIAEDHVGFNALENALYCNDYPRYWHGYAMVMRLLLVFFDYKEMRFINLIFQSFLAIFIFVVLREKGEKKISWMALLWYALMMPLSVACCLVYGYTVDAIFALTIYVMLKGNNIWNDDSKLSIVFGMIGCIVCFFDLLIFSPMGWAMPLAMLVIIYGKNDSVISNLVKTIRSAISWFLGYAVFWLLKMTYAQLIVGDRCSLNVFRGALGEAVWSANRQDSEAVGLIAKIAERWSAVKTNYTHYTYTIYAILILSITIMLIVSFVKRGVNDKRDPRMIPLLIVTSSPVIWVFVINTATKAHHIFDYRLMSTEIVCAFIIIIFSLNSGTLKPGLMVMVKRICIVAGLTFVGIVCVSFTKETQYSMNADKPGMIDVVVQCMDTVSMEFRPVFSRVDLLGLSVSPESEKGELQVSLVESGEIVDETVFPMRDFYENNWQMLSVDWKMSPKKSYDIFFKPIDTDGPITITMLPYSVSGHIPEFGNVKVNDDIQDCQLVAWVGYIRRPSNKNIVTYAMILSGYFAAFLYVMYSVFHRK